MIPLHVLISLHKGYGMGDGVQMSAVLRHVAKYRPHWIVDYQAEPGKHCVGRGIVAHTFAYGEPYPSNHYDAEVQICLYDTWANWHDRPNTRVSSCLHEHFDLKWDAECGRYQVETSKWARETACLFTNPRHGLTRAGYHSNRSNAVAVHYIGDSSPERKNLTHEQAIAICREIERLGFTPLLLDWRNKSPIPKLSGVRSVGSVRQLVQYGGDAELNCAIIAQCRAFVGIDSGPSKCAAATDTPSLVVWTGHHPAPFHDPAPNTTHLVPTGYHGLEPVCNDAGVVEWFENHYNVRQYEGDPVNEVKRWLREVLE